MKIIKPAKKNPKQDKHKPQYTKVFHMKLSKHYDLKTYLIAFFKVFFGGPMHVELRISSHLPPCASGMELRSSGWVGGPVTNKPFNWP